jgi:hypothetical protein
MYLFLGFLFYFIKPYVCLYTNSTLFVSVVLGIKTKALHMQSKQSTTELYAPQKKSINSPSLVFWFVSYYFEVLGMYTWQALHH